MGANVSICVRAGLPKPRLVPDTERTKDTKTLDYASTPLDANTLLWVVLLLKSCFEAVSIPSKKSNIFFCQSRQSELFSVYSAYKTVQHCPRSRKLIFCNPPFQLLLFLLCRLGVQQSRYCE
jgi:hypothetical protein